jgi:metal-sulfur cluster biosynthetic enzyme
MTEELVEKIRETLAKIPDPHMGISIVEMGIVGDIEVNEEEKTEIIVEGHMMADAICEMVNK